MDLWKVTDIYGRENYYESLKPAKVRYKKFMFEYDENVRRYQSPWARTPQVFQVLGDEWIAVQIVDETELRHYIDRRTIRDEENRRKREQNLKELMARREERCRENAKLASGSQT